MVGTRAWARGSPRTTRGELLGFAAVGLLAYATDLALFTFLRGPAALGPLTAKALSFVADCTVAYAGDALGTYRHTRPRGLRPYAVFVAVNLAGAGIGMAPATVLRFWGTRTWVFRTEGRVGSWTG